VTWPRRYPIEKSRMTAMSGKRHLVVLIALLAGAGCSRSTSFSKAAWKATPENDREPMAKDFIANHFHKGMTRAEVVALLGETHPGFPNELQYVVGSVLIDYRMLWIRLDENGKAVDAVIYQTS
jgi:hypothetical protein